jgi:hypothetical protein
VLPVILVLVLPEPTVSTVVHRLINWKVLKTLLFPIFSGFRVNPQAEVRILKGFKPSVFGSADSKRVTSAFFVSADATGFTVGLTFDGGTSEAPRDVPSVRITI